MVRQELAVELESEDGVGRGSGLGEAGVSECFCWGKKRCLHTCEITPILKMEAGIPLEQ